MTTNYKAAIAADKTFSKDLRGIVRSKDYLETNIVFPKTVGTCNRGGRCAIADTKAKNESSWNVLFCEQADVLPTIAWV
jgi:hypothetical protein